MVSATLAADGAARDLHDLRQIQAPCDQLPRRPRRDLDPVRCLGKGEDRQVLCRVLAVQGHGGGDADDGVADRVGGMEILDRVHLIDPSGRDGLHGVDQVFPVSTQEPERLREGILAVPAADPVTDLRLIVSAARVDQRPEFLRIAGRTSGGLADERVRLPDQPFDLLRTASSFEHVGHEGVDDPPSLPEFQIGPAPPVLLDLQVDAEL